MEGHQQGMVVLLVARGRKKREPLGWRFNGFEMDSWVARSMLCYNGDWIYFNNSMLRFLDVPVWQTIHPQGI